MEELEKLKMKVVALKDGYSDRVGKFTAHYEEEIANLRIALTEQSQQFDQLQIENENLRNLAQSLQTALSEQKSESSIIDGEVIEEENGSS